MPSFGIRRNTPSVATSGMHRAIADGRAARGTLRALALLVDRLVTLGVGRPGVTLDSSAQSALRDALRQFTARIRDGALNCRVINGQFVLAGEAVDRGLTSDDPLLGTFLTRCQLLGVGSITVRQGAAPAELFTLGQLFTRSREAEAAERAGDSAAVNGTNRSAGDMAPRPADGAPAPGGDTPTSMRAVDDFTRQGAESRELLRSWSVLVMPVRSAQEPQAAAEAGVAVLAQPDADGTSGSPVATALSRLLGAYDDAGATRAADSLLPLIDEAESRGDAVVLDGVVRTVMSRLHEVGSGGGRLALERIVRRLQHRATLDLLARQLPQAGDRTALLELMSRAGETAVALLVQHLMLTEEPSARRAYFDGIVALDLGGTILFDLLRDSRWYVVRNAVALLGEMGVDQADTVMLPLLAHADERIRVAAARALLRLGTPRALAALHTAIDDANAEVRRIAAVSYGLTPSGSGGVRPPAARLSAALERETNEDAALEMLASMGRLGSADAVQRLLRVALPPTGDGGERPAPREAWLRIAALEALVRARGNAVMPHVETLVNDPDPEVAATAARLLG
jgi:HEAT repeat protein